MKAGKKSGEDVKEIFFKEELRRRVVQIATLRGFFASSLMLEGRSMLGEHEVGICFGGCDEQKA